MTKSCGEQNGQAKLTKTKVKEIRKLFKNGIKREVLARQFHISRGHVNDIIAGRYWKDFEHQLLKLAA